MGAGTSKGSGVEKDGIASSRADNNDIITEEVGKNRGGPEVSLSQRVIPIVRFDDEESPGGGGDGKDAAEELAMKERTLNQIAELASLVDSMQDIIEGRRKTDEGKVIQERIDAMQEEIAAYLASHKIDAENQVKLVSALKRNDRQWETVQKMEATWTEKAGESSIVKVARPENFKPGADAPLSSPLMTTADEEGHSAVGPIPVMGKSSSNNDKNHEEEEEEETVREDEEEEEEEEEEEDEDEEEEDDEEMPPSRRNESVEMRMMRLMMQDEYKRSHVRELVELENLIQGSLERASTVESESTGDHHLQQSPELITMALTVKEKIMKQEVLRMEMHLEETSADREREHMRAEALEEAKLELEMEVQKLRMERLLAIGKQGGGVAGVGWGGVKPEVMNDAAIVVQKHLRRKMMRITYLSHLVRVRLAGRAMIGGARGGGGRSSHQGQRPTTAPAHRASWRSNGSASEREKASEEAVGHSLRRARANLPRPGPPQSLLWQEIEPGRTTAAYLGRPIWSQADSAAAGREEGGGRGLRPHSARPALGQQQQAFFSRTRSAGHSTTLRPLSARPDMAGSSEGNSKVSAAAAADAKLTWLMRVGGVGLLDAAASVIGAYVRCKMQRLEHLARQAREKAYNRHLSRSSVDPSPHGAAAAAAAAARPWSPDWREQQQQQQRGSGGGISGTGRRPMSSSLAAVRPSSARAWVGGGGSGSFGSRPGTASSARPGTAGMGGRGGGNEAVSPLAVTRMTRARGAKEWARDREAARIVMERFVKAEDERGVRHTCASVLQAYMQRKLTRAIYLAHRMRMRKYMVSMTSRRSMSMPKRQVKPDKEMKSALGEPLSTAPGFYTISPPDLNGLYTKEEPQPRRHA